MQKAVADILRINQERLDEIHAPFNPITGKGSVGSRFEYFIEDFPIKRQWLPEAMCNVPLVRQLMAAGSVESFLCCIYSLKSGPVSHSKMGHPRERTKLIK